LDLRKSSYLLPAILAATLIVVNLVSRDVFKRIDLTDNGQFTLSESSKEVLEGMDDLLTMKVYFSDNLPGELGNTRRFLQDILEEYEAYGKKNVRFEFFDPETDEDLEEDAQKSGVIPVQVQDIENDKIEVKKVFMGLAILYEDKREVLPVIQTTSGLEYEITTKIKKLVESSKESVGLATFDGDPDRFENVSRLISERYSVRQIDLSNPVPADINVILARGVTDTLSDSARINLEEFLARSGNMILAQSHVNASLETQQASDIQSDIFDILASYGIQIESNLVLDRSCSRVNVGRNMGFIRMNVPMEYPFLPLVRSFNQEEILVSGLEQIMLFFPSEVTLADSGLSDVSVRPLFSSSSKSAVMSGFYNLSPEPERNPIFQRLNKPAKLIGAISEKVNASSGLLSQIILVSDIRFLDDGSGAESAENHVFIMNAVDYLMGDRGLIELRSREITSRPLKELSDANRKTWKWINIVMPTVLVLGFGFFRNRKQKSMARRVEELYDT
jgi:gliding-associated putative ABC transporter substrate-binding component GldG